MVLLIQKFMQFFVTLEVNNWLNLLKNVHMMEKI